MPIRAHAAGGRVSPHLGPRPPACPPDRAGTHPPWSCDGGLHGGAIAGDAPALDTAVGATLVTLLRSAPRQAYRIYSEEEFLAAKDWQVEAEPEFALLEQTGPRHKPKRWGGFAALVALASVVAAVVGVVALNATKSKPQSNRRFAARGDSLPEIVADRVSIRRLDARPRKHIRRAPVVIRRISEHRLLPVSRPLISEHPYLPPEPPSRAPTPAPAPASAPVSTRATATAATVATAPAHGAVAEFGFERR